MNKCVICERELAKDEIEEGLFFCKKCINHLKRLNRIDFNEAQYVTKKQAYTNLFLAIRHQAIIDGELEDFEYYWVHSLGVVWGILYDGMREVLEIESTIHTYI